MNIFNRLLRHKSTKYIFVAGCPHSGTSLAAAMLGAHPTVYAIPFETKAFLEGRTGDQARAVIEDAAGAGDRQAATVCEKTPMHIHHVASMADTFPGARFVICLRDPRDVACSLKRRHGDLGKGIARWQKDNRAALDLMGRPDCYALRYETLVAAPQDELKKLCAFLGLPYRQSMMNFWRDERDWFGVSDRRNTDGAHGQNHAIRRNWQIHQPMMTDRVGVWRRELSEDEIADITQRLSPLAQKLDYPLD